MTSLLVSGKYVNPFTDRAYPRVTSIVGVIGKQNFLVPWAAKVTAEVAFDLRDTICAQGRDAAIQVVKNESKKRREHNANLGSAVHAAIHALVTGGEYVPDPEYDVDAHVEQFQRFLGEWHPEFLVTEAHCFSDAYSYAGTLDAIVRIEGLGTFVLDYKTGSLYPEAGLQLAAYQHAEYLIVGPPWNKRDMPKLDGALVLRITAEDYELRPVDTGDDVFDTFVFCSVLVEFERMTAPTVIGERLRRDRVGEVLPPALVPEAPSPASPPVIEVDPPDFSTALTTLRGRLNALPTDYRNRAKQAWKRNRWPSATSTAGWTKDLLAALEVYVSASEEKAEAEAKERRQRCAFRLQGMGVDTDDRRHEWVAKFNGKDGLRDCTVEELRKIELELDGKGIA